MPELISFEWSKAINGYLVETFYPEDIKEIDSDELDYVETPAGPLWRPIPVLKENARPSTRRLVEIVDCDLLMAWSYERGRTPVSCIVPRGPERLKYKPLSDSPGLFMEFADLTLEPDSIVQFAAKYGPLRCQEFELLDDWYKEIREMKSAVESWQQAKARGSFWDFPEKYWRGKASAAIELRPRTDYSAMILSLIPPSLKDALWLQFAQAVSANQSLRRCAVCPKWFPYGTGTGRRKSASYCSDRCRKAAFYQRWKRETHDQTRTE